MDSPFGSTSTPYSYDPRPVSLPSLAEMFPEHIVSRGAPNANPASRFPPSVAFPESHMHMYLAPPPSAFPVDVNARTDCHPRALSLEQHLRLASTSAARFSIASFPSSPASASGSGPDQGNVDAATDAEVEAEADEGDDESESLEDDTDDGQARAQKLNLKQHVCRKCGKRFNRPSSLKIHLNTHSGAQPYCCPFPGCGRAFNVNSNMRRHLRNHPAPPAPAPALRNHSSQAQTQAPTPAPAPTPKTSTRASPIRPDASPPATYAYVPRRITRSSPHPAHAPPAPAAGNFHTYLGYYTHTPTPAPLRTWTPAPTHIPTPMRHCESDVRSER